MEKSIIRHLVDDDDLPGNLDGEDEVPVRAVHGEQLSPPTPRHAEHRQDRKVKGKSI